MSAIPIFLPSDNNYAPQVSAAIASICSNTKSFINFYILDGGITPENQVLIRSMKKQFDFDIEFLTVDVEKYFEGFSCPSQFTKSTYNRFVLPKLKPDMGKILYIDSDVIVQGDIQELFDIDLDGYLMAAVPEDMNDALREDCRNLGISEQHKYFNAGVMILDNKKWIETGLDKKLFETELKFRDKIQWADQDVLNIIFDNNYKVLDEKYNWQTHKNASNPDALIRHYNTYIKPWAFNPEIKNTIIFDIPLFWDYLKLTPYYEQMLEKVSDIKAQKELMIKHRMEKLKMKGLVK